MESDVRNPDAALHVRFQMISVYQVYDSNNALLPDGKPNPNHTGSAVYRDVPHIEITTPGGYNRIVEPVRNEHKARFPKHWAMFEMSQGGGDGMVGTKISEWPAITRSRAEELRAMKYYTVEQIANASDAQVQGLGMDGIMLRRKAEQFLKVAGETAHAEFQSAELAKRDAELAELKRQVAELVAAMAAPAPKRGHPKKLEQAPA